MIIEYQDGIENWDIPYFTGMSSVKMPVLTTTGKNLFELPQSDKMLKGSIGKYIKLNLKPNTNYTYNSILDKKGNTAEFDFYGWISNDTNSNFTGYEVFHWKLNKTFSKTFNTGNDEWYFHVYGEQKGDDYRNYLINFQLEEGSVATAYEPYKTNILSTPSDLELRGIGDVKDTLDCLTGELTQRIGEVVLNGSENWVYEPSYTNDNVYGCYIGLHLLPQKPKPNNFNFANNMFPNITNSSYQSEGFATNPGVLSLRIAKDKLESADLSGFKKYLQNNPVILQYPLESESIKTVDLSPGVLSLRIAKDKLESADLSGFKKYLQNNPVILQYPLESESIKTVDLSSSGNWEKVVLDGSEDWGADGNLYCFCRNLQINSTCAFTDSIPVLPTKTYSLPSHASFSGSRYFTVLIDGILNDPAKLKQYLRQNPLTVWYQTTTTQDNSIREMLSFANGHLQVSSEAENSLLPSVQYEIPTKNSYHMDLMKTNTLYTMKAKTVSGTFTIDGSEAENSLLPSVQYEIPTKNSYHMDLMKTNTLYTMKAKTVSGTFTIDGTSYNVNANGTFTSPSSMTDKLLCKWYFYFSIFHDR